MGLAVLVYPHTWPSLGTTEPQFVRIEWQTGEQLHFTVPSGSVKNPSDLLLALEQAISEGSEKLASELRQVHKIYSQIIKKCEELANREADLAAQNYGIEQLRVNSTSADVGDGDGSTTYAKIDDEKLKQIRNNIYTESLHKNIQKQIQEVLNDRERHVLAKHLHPFGFELWIQTYKNARSACKFTFDSQRQRFLCMLDPKRVRFVELSAQLAYILGFHSEKLSEAQNMARYPPDMKGGVSAFYVYTPGLIEPVIIGDVVAPVLRIVNIRGAPDEMIEECYTAVQYHKLVVKEISEIFVEIRTASGSLMPFQYGNCRLTLHFKKAPYF
ncbi:MAG: hypothetical protein ACTHJ4_06315 [Candidatus Nucleicultricaceae bacterium]